MIFYSVTEQYKEFCDGKNGEVADETGSEVESSSSPGTWYFAILLVSYYTPGQLDAMLSLKHLIPVLIMDVNLKEKRVAVKKSIQTYLPLLFIFVTKNYMT